MERKTVKRLILLVISLLFIAVSCIFAQTTDESLPELGTFPSDSEVSFEEFQKHIAEADRCLDKFEKSRQILAQTQDESSKSLGEFKEQMQEVDKTLDEFEESHKGPPVETIYEYEDYQEFEETVVGVEYKSDKPTLFIFGGGDFIVEQHFGLGSEYSFIRYEEPGVMEEEGMMYGINGFYSCRSKNNVVFKLEAKTSWGKVDYASVNTGTMDDLDDYMFEVRTLGGLALYPSERMTVMPYIGFGYRYLYDDLRGTSTTGAKGYEREANYFYFPLGAEADVKLRNDWSVGATFEFDFFARGIQRSYLSQAISGLNDLSNDQKQGYGLRGSLRLKKKMDKIDFLLEPFVRYWDIEKSEEALLTYTGVIIGYGYEPANNSLEYGLKCAVGF